MLLFLPYLFARVLCVSVEKGYSCFFTSGFQNPPKMSILSGLRDGFGWRISCILNIISRVSVSVRKAEACWNWQLGQLRLVWRRWRGRILGPMPNQPYVEQTRTPKVGKLRWDRTAHLTAEEQKVKTRGSSRCLGGVGCKAEISFDKS